MTEPNILFLAPRIKCYASNNKLYKTRFYDTGKKTVERIRKLTEEKWLWTGESTHCICNHHVEQHCTVRDEYGHEITTHCHGSDERCNCEDFRTCSIRLSHSNCYKMVTEE